MTGKRVKSFLMALVMLLGLLPMTLVSASAEEEELPSYNAITDFSATDNPNGVWSFQYKSGASFVNMAKRNENDGWTNGDAGTLQITGSYFTAWNNSATYETVISFTAPYSGTISVSMANGGVKRYNAGQTPKFKLYKNSEVLMEELVPAGDGCLTEAQELTVVKGDVIRFATMRSAANASGHAILNPAVTYTEVKPGYNAVMDFSATENPNGVWSFQYWTGSAYANMTKRDQNDGWTNASAGPITVGDSYFTTWSASATYETVIAFAAPYTGTISISMVNGGVKRYNDAQTPRFKLYKNSEVLMDELVPTGAGVFTEARELTVTRGDVIRFATMRSAAGASGHALLNPTVTYTEVMPSYDAIADFSATENPNGVWSFQYKSGASFVNMTKRDQNDGWTNGNAGILQITGSYFTAWNNSATYETIIAFTAPYTGTISVSMANGGVKRYNASQTPKFKLYKNSEVLMEELIPTGNGCLTEAQELTVEKGDVIRFATMRSNQSQSGHAILNPEVSYTEIKPDPYNAFVDFSLAENPNGVWKYQYKSGASYVDMTETNGADAWTYAPSGSMQKAAGTSYLTSWNLSATLENVLTFTAPYSGTIRITMTNGGVKARDGGQTPRFKLYYNDDTLMDVSSITTAGCFTEAKELVVREGDEIRFATMRTLQGSSGHAIFNPKIVYTSLEEPETFGTTTYYVSSTDGSDDYTGTSVNTPFRSLSKLADLELTADTYICLKAGDTWTDEQLVLNHVSGTKASPVVVTKYGTGDDPVLDLDRTEDAGTATSELAVPVVLLKNAAGLEIRDLYITGSGVGIDFHYENSFNNEYIKVADCTFKDLTGFHQADERTRGVADRYLTAGAVCVSTTNNCFGVTDPSVIGFYLDNCLSDNCGSLIVGNQSPYLLNESQGVNINGTYITNCTMSGNDYYGTILGGNGGYMDNCVIEDCGDDATGGFTPGTAGIMISGKNFAIINTKITGQQRAGIPHDGIGIDLEHSCDNVVISNCWFENNAGAGVMFYESKKGSVGANTNCVVENCTFKDNSTEAATSSHPYCDVYIVAKEEYSASNCRIENNRYYYSGAGSYVFVRESQAAPAVANTIQNNTEFDGSGTFVANAALTATYAATYADYNASTYTADMRTGRAAPLHSYAYASHTHSSEFGAASTIWKYRYYDLTESPAVWGNMTYSGANTRWEYGAGFVSATATMPNTYGVITTQFIAPQTGRICISMSGILQLWHQNNANNDGVYITVLNGDKQLICDPIKLTKASATRAFTPVYVDVAAGEIIYFCVSKIETNAADGTSINPVIEYIYTFDTVDETADVNVADLARLIKHVTGAEVTVDAYNADVNGDGACNSTDATLMREFLTGVYN